MGSITWSRVAAFDKLYLGCQGGGITCIGNGEMLAYYEEVGWSGDPGGGGPWNAQRIFRSSDNGQTWSQITEYLEPTVYSGLNDWFPGPGRMFSPGTGQAVVVAMSVISTNDVGAIRDNYLQFDGITPGAGVLPYTTDSGMTWANKAINLGPMDIDGATLVGQTGSVGGYTILSPDEWWISGYWEELTTFKVYSYIKTIDAGLTWSFEHEDFIDLPNTQWTHDGVYLGSDRVVMGHSTSSNAATILVSTDRGSTWSTSTLPTTGFVGTIFFTVTTTVADLGGGVLLAGGQVYGSPNSLAWLWRSIDNGDTWTSERAAIPDLVTSNDNGTGVLHILNLGGGRAVLQMSGRSIDGAQFWRLTEDYGVTWTTCTMLDTPLSTDEYDPYQIAISEDGALVATVADFDGFLEIWRGEVDGFSVVSPCTDVTPPPPPPTSPTLSVLCVPFSGPLCTTPEPIDPTITLDTGGNSGNPGGLGASGLRSPLFLLGLAADGTPVASGGIFGFPLVKPTACTPFVKNDCITPEN